MEDTHGLKNGMPCINDARHNTARKAVCGRHTAILEVWKEDLQDKLIGDDRELAALGLEI